MAVNPFAALLETNSSPTEDKFECEPLEKIFGFTLRDTYSESNNLLPLKTVVSDVNETELNTETLQTILFERLLLCSVYSLKPYQDTDKISHAFDNRVLTYLFDSYKNTCASQDLTDVEKSMVKSTIMQNLVTSVKEPGIYENQDLNQQLYDVLKNELSYHDIFFQDLCDNLLKDDKEDLTEVIKGQCNILRKSLLSASLISFDYSTFSILRLLTYNETTADAFITACYPGTAEPVAGIEYASTLLGALFNLSTIPKVANEPYEHFLSPLDHVSNSVTENNLWLCLDNLTGHIHEFLLRLLKLGGTVREKTLQWLGNCLTANTDRGKLWNSHTPIAFNPGGFTTVSDGFMVNLTNVLLRFCQPFCTKAKIMKVDPTYCAVPDNKMEEKGLHISKMATQTCLISAENPEDRLTANQYSFVTECFYLAHRSIDLGYRVSYEKVIQINQELSQIERTYNEAIQQSTDNSDAIGMLKDRMEQGITRYLCHKIQLLEPNLVKMMFNFMSVSSYWLTQVSVHILSENNDDFVPKNEIEVTFPLPEQIPDTLKCIPEFIVENIVTFLICQRRFNPDAFELAAYESLSPILTFIIIFMASKERMNNPHIRAHLAEALEAMLPFHKEEKPRGLNKLGGLQREMLFTNHKHRNQIVRSLLEVFVGIEMTGQSVEFEQKFNYRRPMYTVMNYLWEKEEYEISFKKLAEEAERNMEAMTPPLFLRFVNLLLNDAVFLLDESLSNMAKLKDMQQARENGEWENLPLAERTQNISYLHHLGMIARFDNILGKETIKELERLTSKITIVFTHSTIVDRVAAMLNYFLLNLVGPNKKNFKVKDQKEYDFDPAATVILICKIYINLKESDTFCLAVSQDGRSYSHRLFEQAEDVLIRIGGGMIIDQLKEVAEKVARKAEEYQAIEENITDVPEHFLDPIMSTLMTDPVVLPSSKQTVDRNTIARHLLSDQTDPFNRAPLSMDQVIPNVELAEEIKRWKAERNIA